MIRLKNDIHYLPHLIENIDITDGVMTGKQNKLRIAVLFGGRSPEHDVSVLSATNVMQALDADKYEAVPIFVTREGQWLLSSYEQGQLAKPSSGTEICLVSGGYGRIIGIDAQKGLQELPKIDALFPVLHGLHGEDGAVQGLAEVACIPLIGCGILGSAVALDKDMTKRVNREAAVPVAYAVTLHSRNVPEFEAVKNALGLPFFVKPARQGSSVGVNKVATPADYRLALDEGFRHDNKLLAEEFIRGREIECAVLEDADGTLFVSRCGEITPAESHGFYSYDAKYTDENGAALKVPADLPVSVETQIREMAKKAFRAVGCDAMARVDFFVTDDMRIILNEINTIPGFTDISMYSKVMAVSGVSYAQILDRLIAHGLKRSS